MDKTSLSKEGFPLITWSWVLFMGSTLMQISLSR